ncbi:probable pinoresinol-lariciresinol reductase 3 [Vigna umbellata]|uniref:probable pinoresinol-lariciresinol reductase 3 n=1 Tax=Vigna umbellata TaxID=87088 RepID=UPI001F5FD8A9|nr:probable pinoresinol-lariciresinol reductase 3 [Vigna umbellata]
MEKSKILIIGVTGSLGYHLAEASLKFCHPTFALVRHSAFSHPIKAQKLHSLSQGGATLLTGSMEDETPLREAVRLVDVVIAPFSGPTMSASKAPYPSYQQLGSVKRFIPSEFGSDPTRAHVSELDDLYNFYAPKVEIRRLLEAEGIPYTVISCNFFMKILLPSLLSSLDAPPRDKVTVYGNGNTKGVFMKESDVAAFTISTVDDPRTLNKVLYLRPPENVCSLNELVEMWEIKIGKKLERLHVSEGELLQKIKGTSYPANYELLFIYSAFINGDHTYFDIEPPSGVNGTQLYPHVKFTTVSEFLAH